MTQPGRRTHPRPFAQDVDLLTAQDALASANRRAEKAEAEVAAERERRSINQKQVDDLARAWVAERERAEKAEAEVERLRAALNALVIVNGSEIGYRTMHNIPMAMSKRIESKVRATLRGEGEKCPECEGSGATGAGKPCCSVRRGEGKRAEKLHDDFRRSENRLLVRAEKAEAELEEERDRRVVAVALAAKLGAVLRELLSLAEAREGSGYSP